MAVEAIFSFSVFIPGQFCQIFIASASRMSWQLAPT